MILANVFSQLVTWTPFLLDGFLWNIIIALVATTIGYFVGAGLACCQELKSKQLARFGRFFSSFFLRVPTTAALFYVAILLPNEFDVPWIGQNYLIPTWIKAALALSSAQIGFASQNIASTIRFWKRGDRLAVLLFIPTFTANILITILASSSASLIGVSELVSRCNKVINASDNADLMIPFYIYASLIFLVFCYPFIVAMDRLKKIMQSRLQAEVAFTQPDTPLNRTHR